MNDFKVAMLGFGNVGRELAVILTKKDADVRKRYGRGISVTAIATNSRGTLYDPAGIDLDRALKEIKEGGRFSADHPALSHWDSVTIAREGDFDAILEMTPLNIKTGLPAADHIRFALERGKHAVTANKGPIAWHYRELRDLARSKGVRFYFESTVMDGTPLFNLADNTLRLCEITEVSGILNSTTNVILMKLEEGLSYEEALAEGRKLGIVEADPSMDVDGHDPTAKIIAMANVLMDAELTPDQVDRNGIAGIGREEILAAKSRGNTIKLLCKAKKENGQVTASVLPTEIPTDHVYATVDGASSVYSIVTDYMGKLTMIEHDGTPLQTGYGVFGDILRILEEPDRKERP
ncbi:MAG: homoserine dehydrogenase [Clostridiales bacterium]|mgnify:FL=1|nr:homoserine dehydrogenase [Clostridiales bacterium]